LLQILPSFVVYEASHRPCRIAHLPPSFSPPFFLRREEMSSHFSFRGEKTRFRDGRIDELRPPAFKLMILLLLPGAESSPLVDDGKDRARLSPSNRSVFFSPFPLARFGLRQASDLPFSGLSPPSLYPLPQGRERESGVVPFPLG